MTAGMMVLSLGDDDGDGDLVLVAAVVKALFGDGACVLDRVDWVTAEESELNCAASVTTEVVNYVVVDIAPPASVTILCWVKDTVVKEVGTAADVMASVPN
jgi:hypothetical protein